MDKEMKEIFDAQKDAWKRAYQTGWDHCLDDIREQLKHVDNLKKITFQYYGELDKE